jgi:hypothetical protein
MASGLLNNIEEVRSRERETRTTDAHPCGKGSLTLCLLATSVAGRRSASRRIATICLH